MGSENQRLRGSGQELEAQLRSAIEQNRAIKNVCTYKMFVCVVVALNSNLSLLVLYFQSIDPKLVDQLQRSLLTLQRQYTQQKEETEKRRIEFEERLAEAQRETHLEKERADSCLTSSFAEREEVEKRWEERWTRHQTSLNEQLESLKTSYEKTLITAKEHEAALQVSCGSGVERNFVVEARCMI